MNSTDIQGDEYCLPCMDIVAACFGKILHTTAFSVVTVTVVSSVVGPNLQ